MMSPRKRKNLFYFQIALTQSRAEICREALLQSIFDVDAEKREFPRESLSIQARNIQLFPAYLLVRSAQRKSAGDSVDFEMSHPQLDLTLNALRHLSNDMKDLQQDHPDRALEYKLQEQRALATYDYLLAIREED